MAGRVAGKVAFVTGAARGQGRAHCIRLAQEGADIIALDVCAPIAGHDGLPGATSEDLQETVRLVDATGRRILAFEGDTRSYDDVANAVRSGLEAFGRVDIAIANAGVTGSGLRAHEISEETWRSTIDINLTGVWHTAKAVLPSMIDAGNGGSIVLTSSAVGLRPRRHLADYGSTKAAVIMLTKVLALEYGADGIRVNALAPGNVETPMVMNDKLFRQFRPDIPEPTKDDVAETFAQMNALTTRAWLAPEEMANAVLWLCSDEGSGVTGQVLSVDLGMAIG